MTDTGGGKTLIVVGVDGGNAGMAALRWTLRTAVHVDAVVDVVHAWTDREPSSLIARELWIAMSIVDDPPEVRERYERGAAADVLVACSHRAQLLVVGVRTRPGGDLAGPVALACRRDAHCPVAVIDENGRQWGTHVSVAASPREARRNVLGDPTR